MKHILINGVLRIGVILLLACSRKGQEHGVLPLHKKLHWSQQRDAELASAATVSAWKTVKSVSGRSKKQQRPNVLLWASRKTNVKIYS